MALSQRLFAHGKCLPEERFSLRVLAFVEVDACKHIEGRSDFGMLRSQHTLKAHESGQHEVFSLLVVTVKEVEVGQKIESAGRLRMLWTKYLFSQSKSML